MVLAGLEQLQIRALFSQISSAVSLRRVALEVASELGGGPPASNVELCMCPASYRGDSCQVRHGHRDRPWGCCPPASLPPPTHAWPGRAQSPASALVLSPHLPRLHLGS